MYFVYGTLSWSWQPKWLRPGGAGIGVWLFLIDATISQFLGDIVEYNLFIFSSTVDSVLKLVTSFAAIA